MRYLVICKLDSPFLTEWLLFPSWEYSGGDVVCIIDTQNKKYIQYHEWKNETEEPQWKEIQHDHL